MCTKNKTLGNILAIILGTYKHFKLQLSWVGLTYLNLNLKI